MRVTIGIQRCCMIISRSFPRHDDCANRSDVAKFAFYYLIPNSTNSRARALLTCIARTWVVISAHGIFGLVNPAAISAAAARAADYGDEVRSRPVNRKYSSCHWVRDTPTRRNLLREYIRKFKRANKKLVRSKGNRSDVCVCVCRENIHENICMRFHVTRENNRERIWIFTRVASCI